MLYFLNHDPTTSFFVRRTAHPSEADGYAASFTGSICRTFGMERGGGVKAQRRTLFKSILILGLLASFFIVYLHVGLFPGRLKPFALEKVTEITQMQVDFDKILVLPFQGLSLHNLKVSDKTGAPLFSAKKLAVNIDLISFFREKKIIISNVYLDSPVYDYVIEPKKIIVAQPPLMTRISGQIRVPLASDEKKLELETISDGPDFFLPDNVYLEQIEIENGFVSIRKKVGDPIAEEIHSINIRMAFQKPPDLLFDGFLRLGHEPYAQIMLKGSWNLKSGIYSFYLQTRSDTIPDWLLEYQKNNFLILKQGRFMLETRLKSTKDGKAFFQSQAQLYDSLINLRTAEYSGRMDIRAKGLFDFDSKSITRYQGTLDLINVNVKNLSEKIPELKNLKGRVLFQPDLLTLERVMGHYQSLAFKATGTLRSFKELLLNATIYTDSKINEVLALLSEEQKKLIGKLDIQGNCQAVTTVHGTLRKSSELQTDYKILVRDGTIMSPDKKINLSKVAAQISVDDAGFRISRCGFTAADKNYTLSAFIPKSSESLRTLNLASKDFDLEASYALDKNTVLVQKATARSNGLSAVFRGQLSNLNDPTLDVEGDVTIALNRIKPLLSTYAPALKDAELDGTLSGPFILKGTWNDPTGWNLSADVNGDQVSVKKNLHLGHFELQMRLKDKVVSIPYLRANPYQGTLGANLRMDLTKTELPFEGKVFANNLNLRMLAQDIAPQQKDLSGTAIFQTTLSGQLKSQGTYLGSGSVSIREGKLWQTNLFKAMGKLPFLKVEGLDSVTFHDLSASFDIHDKKLWTQNLNLLSDTVDLSLRGSVGFDQTLDLLMDIQYSNSVKLGAMDTGGLAPFIVEQVGDFISQYRIRGTLKEPKFDKMLLPIGHVIGKKISSLLGVA